MGGAYIHITDTTVIVRTIRITIRGTIGHSTHGIGVRPGPGATTHIGLEVGAILTGHGVHHVRRLIITAMGPDRLGILPRPDPTDLTARHRQAVHLVAVPGHRTMGIRLPTMECLAPAIWDEGAATAPLPYHQHLPAPEDMLHRTRVRVLCPVPDIAVEALAAAMATDLHQPIAVAAHTHLRAIRPRRAATAARIVAVAAVGHIAVVVAVGRMAEVRMVAVAAEEAEEAAADVVDKITAKASLHSSLSIEL